MSHVLVLTAAAGVGADLADAWAAALTARGMAAHTPRRLAASAVEIGFDGRAHVGGDLWGQLAAALDGAAAANALDVDLVGAAVDANVVAAQGREKRLLVADMDSTIIGVECIDELADFAGLKPQVAAVTEAAMRGELDFEAALDARVALLAGLPEAALQACYDARVRLNAGARTLVRTMAARGASTALVSGGFDFFTARVAAAAGFAHHQANRLEVAGGRLAGAVARPVLGRAAKRAALERHAAEAGIELAETVAVGDGANDLDMIAAAGMGVAYRAKPALAAAADVRLEHSDLTAILALQGIPEADWRT